MAQVVAHSAGRSSGVCAGARPSGNAAIRASAAVRLGIEVSVHVCTDDKNVIGTTNPQLSVFPSSTFPGGQTDGVRSVNFGMADVPVSCPVESV
ncbi:hypothetical protein Axi01nite_80890 [Actinoplanes xinjiangensis]|nr:hypothetical protein Axi01nite_80890 [Actinoplanes xinjiangensis]